MADPRRRGGIIFVKVNGDLQQAKGSWSYNLGKPKREPIVGADGVHGYKEMPQPAYIEGKITDRGDLDLAALVGITDSTVTLELANGKTILLNNAWWGGDGTVSTEEGEIEARFDGITAEEIPAS
jgi:hypothetical protein